MTLRVYIAASSYVEAEAVALRMRIGKREWRYVSRPDQLVGLPDQTLWYCESIFGPRYSGNEIREVARLQGWVVMEAYSFAEERKRRQQARAEHA